jgi:hypothetical protein
VPEFVKKQEMALRNDKEPFVSKIKLDKRGHAYYSILPGYK